MREIFIHTYDNIISIDNLLLAWQGFIKGKKNKKDVQEFQLKLMDNIIELHADLKNKTYTHNPYTHFKINDPKPRDIHKATVLDRIVHHLIYNALYQYFDKLFIYDSYSCRVGKGTHRALARFKSFSLKCSKNNTKQCFVLKCDIKKFFASIDHEILKNTLVKSIQDKDILKLLESIIDSFSARQDLAKKKGLPLGNLTSQLLVNIYMNEFDQYMKHNLKVKYYIRYADDFVVFSNDKLYLQNLITKMLEFLHTKLHLQMHPSKVFIKTIYSGVDFLGWVHFPTHRVLRNATKWRMFRNLEKNNYSEASSCSYLGILQHGNSYKLQQKIYAIIQK